MNVNFGTMTKPLHSGRAAQQGVLAAMLGARGFTASPSALEGRGGYFESFVVTAQDVCPEALCISGDAERIYQDFRFLGDGLDDVPALLFGRGDE